MTRKKFAGAAALAAGALVLGAVLGQPGNGRASGTAPPPPTGCPAGTGPIRVGSLTPPARLLIQPVGVTPNPVTSSTASIQLEFLVTACDGRPVAGANLFAVTIPFNQFAATEGTTGADGKVTLTQSRLRGFPARTRNQQFLAVFARATKPGEPILGGVSSRRVISSRVSLG
jgi:hypothetical protein